MLRITFALLLAALVSGAGLAVAQDYPLVLYRDWQQCGYPEWSPDGEWIVFTAGGTDTEEGDLWVVPAKGGEPVQITGGGGHHGNFSPDSKFIALDAARGTVVQVVPASGGTAIRIVPEGIDVEHSGNPCWSPDGRMIIFRANEDLCTVELATGKIATVFHRDGFKPLPIQWLKSENSVVASLISVEERTANLFRINIDTGEAMQLTDSLRITQATVSPCETMLVYSAFLDPETRDYDLWALPLEGGEPVQLTAGPTYDLNPCWSPAGGRLVYVVFFEGEFRIQVVEMSVAAINSGWEPLTGWEPMDDGTG